MSGSGPEGEEDELEMMLKMQGLEDEDDGNLSKALKEGEAGGIDASLSVPAHKEGEPTGNKTITDKEFYKAMQKLKDRGNNAVPPKKSASAYIIFGKEVSLKHILQIKYPLRAYYS